MKITNINEMFLSSICFLYIENMLNISITQVVDFIYLYMRKQIFMYIYEKVNKIKF